MKILLFLLILLAAPLLQAEIFKWVDDQGNVHFSDQNQEGSRPIELKPTTVIETPAAPAPTAQPQQTGEQARQEAAVAYESVKIVQPNDDESIRSNGEGVINVMIEREPQLSRGDSYRLTMNGDVIEPYLTSGVIPLENVDRGSHTLSVEIVDQSGNSLISSEEITFHVLRVANPPRPAPTPR